MELRIALLNKEDQPAATAANAGPAPAQEQGWVFGSLGLRDSRSPADPQTRRPVQRSRRLLGTREHNIQSCKTSGAYSLSFWSQVPGASRKVGGASGPGAQSARQHIIVRRTDPCRQGFQSLPAGSCDTRASRLAPRALGSRAFALAAINRPSSRGSSIPKQRTRHQHLENFAGPEHAIGRSVIATERPAWERGQDSNLRPSGYEPDELPDCSTPHQHRLL